MNKFINKNDFEIIRHRDCFVQHNWKTNFVDEDTSRHAIYFISQKSKLGPFLLTNMQSIIHLKVWGLIKENHLILSLFIIDQGLNHCI